MFGTEVSGIEPCLPVARVALEQANDSLSTHDVGFGDV